MWDVNEQSFCVGVHTLTLDIEDIYFLMGLSRCGSQVSLIGSKGGEEPMDYYVSHHCMTGTKKHSGKVAIRDVQYLPLWTILYNITQMAGTATPHMDFQIHFQYTIECMEPRVFNWCGGVLKNMKNKLTKYQKGWLRVHFGVFLLGEGPRPTSAGGVGYAHSTRSTDEDVGGPNGSSQWRAYRQV
jgi:hypothetical protein